MTFIAVPKGIRAMVSGAFSMNRSKAGLATRGIMSGRPHNNMSGIALNHSKTGALHEIASRIPLVDLSEVPTLNISKALPGIADMPLKTVDSDIASFASAGIMSGRRYVLSEAVLGSMDTLSDSSVALVASKAGLRPEGIQSGTPHVSGLNASKAGGLRDVASGRPYNYSGSLFASQSVYSRLMNWLKAYIARSK